MSDFLRSVSPGWLALYTLCIIIGVAAWIRFTLALPEECDRLPAGVAAFSWPAFLLPIVWPLANKRPRLAVKTLGVLFAAGLPSLVPALVTLDLVSLEGPIPLGVYFALAVSQVALHVVANLVAMLYSGRHAHPVYWCDATDRLDPADFLRRQRKWLFMGAALTAVWIASLSLQVAARMADLPPWALQ